MYDSRYTNWHETLCALAHAAVQGVFVLVLQNFDYTVKALAQPFTFENYYTDTKIKS